MEKRICDQLGVVRLGLPEARMDQTESRYRASFCSVSRCRLELVPSLFFDALGNAPSIPLVPANRKRGQSTISCKSLLLFLDACSKSGGPTPEGTSLLRQ